MKVYGQYSTMDNTEIISTKKKSFNNNCESLSSNHDLHFKLSHRFKIDRRHYY